MSQPSQNGERRKRSSVSPPVSFNLGNLGQSLKLDLSNNQTFKNTDSITEIIASLLYLGDFPDATNKQTLKDNNIMHIVNLAEELPPPILSGLHLLLKDHSDENIFRHFAKVIQFIHKCILTNEPVLVHCKMGYSRAPSFVIAYLMFYGSDPTCRVKMEYDAAFDYVKQRRVLISPNLGFILQLHKLESILFPKKPARHLFLELEESEESKESERPLSNDEINLLNASKQPILRFDVVGEKLILLGTLKVQHDPFDSCKLWWDNPSYPNMPLEKPMMDFQI